MDAGNTKTAERGEKILGKERYRNYGHEETGRAGQTYETITESPRSSSETVREETAITAVEVETVREAEDHSVSVPHVQTEADREIMAEDRSQERMMIPRIRTAVREETAAEPSIRALQAIQ